MGDEHQTNSPEPDGLDDLADRIADRVAEILTGGRSLDRTQNEWLTAGQLATREPRTTRVTEHLELQGF
jgi:hypothetical protein